MKTKAQFQFLRTGNRQQRDMTAIRCRNDPQVFTYYDLVECIDAPDEIPAGSCTREDFTNWRGRQIVSQTIARRG